MSEGDEWDVAVVGGGIAGLVTGVRLAELGKRVVLLEQGEQEKYLCNSRFNGGLFQVCHLDINADDTVLMQAIMKNTNGFANPELAAAVAKETKLVVQWLKTKGIRFIKGGPEGWQQNLLPPPGLMKPGLQWEGRGSDVMVCTLGKAFNDLGGKTVLGTRARRLRTENGRCAGLEVEQNGGTAVVRSNSVVLCDGGFQANHELMREFITPAPEKLRQRGAATGKGDGLRMAREVGAHLVGTSNFYGHVLCQEAMHNDRLWPYPQLDAICVAGVVIDASGKRFLNEGLGGVYTANSIARLKDPLSTTVVFDEAIWNGPGREHIVPANPHVVTSGATILKAPDLRGLSEQLGLPQAALEATIAQYNAAIDAGQTNRLDPPRTTSAYRAYPVRQKPLYPIRQKPYYAIRLCAGITYTMGGIAIDGMGRVMDADSKPIPGLYAAGCTAGGLEGGEFSGYVGGLSKSSVTAMRAANHIGANGAA